LTISADGIDVELGLTVSGDQFLQTVSGTVTDTG
jgi:hypothetical protein